MRHHFIGRSSRNFIIVKLTALHVKQMLLSLRAYRALLSQLYISPHGDALNAKKHNAI